MSSVGFVTLYLEERCAVLRGCVCEHPVAGRHVLPWPCARDAVALAVGAHDVLCVHGLLASYLPRLLSSSPPRLLSSQPLPCLLSPSPLLPRCRCPRTWQEARDQSSRRGEEDADKVGAGNEKSDEEQRVETVKAAKRRTSQGDVEIRVLCSGRNGVKTEI
eukprot:3736283-Rhodomonas_salina.2